MLKKILFLCLFTSANLFAQDNPINIKAEEAANRLQFYAFNQSETDYDVKIIITGTNIRQSSAKPRFYRVPAASKVLLKTLIVTRGKKPSYTYKLEINDSLSRRAIKQPATPIKIKPKKQIIVYLTNDCLTCDSIISMLEHGKYIYNAMTLSEKPNVREQLAKALKYSKTPLDSVSNPVVSLGGVLHTDISNYEALLEAVRNE